MTTISFHTNILTLYYKGKHYSIPYWADGYGRHVADYITSVVQLRNLLLKKLSAGPLEFYCLMDKKKRPITTDKHIIQALEDVPNGGSLAVYAYDHKELDFAKLLSPKKKKQKKDKDEAKDEKEEKKEEIKKEVIKKKVTKKKSKKKKGKATSKKKKDNKKSRRRSRSPRQLK